MEFHDKLVDRFQDLSKLNKIILLSTRPRFNYHALEIYVLNIEENYRPNLTVFLDIYLYLNSKNNDDFVKHM